MLETINSRPLSGAHFHHRAGVRALLQADRVLLVDPSRGRYYALHGLAGQVWPLLALDLTVAEIAERLEAPGVAPVVSALIAARLIEPANGGTVRDAAAGGSCCG